MLVSIAGQAAVGAEPTLVTAYFALPSAAAKGDLDAAVGMIERGMWNEMAAIDVRSGPCAAWRGDGAAAAPHMTRRQVWGDLLANWATRHRELGPATAELMATARAAIDADPVEHPVLLSELAWLCQDVEPKQRERLDQLHQQTATLLGSEPTPGDAFVAAYHLRLRGEMSDDGAAFEHLVSTQVEAATDPLTRCLLQREHARWTTDPSPLHGAIGWSAGVPEQSWQKAVELAGQVGSDHLTAEVEAEGTAAVNAKEYDPTYTGFGDWLLRALDAHRLALAEHDDALAGRAAATALRLAVRIGRPPTDAEPRQRLEALARLVLDRGNATPVETVQAQTVAGMIMASDGDQQGVELLRDALTMADDKRDWEPEIYACRALAMAKASSPPGDISDDPVIEAGMQAKYAAMTGRSSNHALNALVCRELLDALWTRHHQPIDDSVIKQAAAEYHEMGSQVRLYDLWATTAGRLTAAGRGIRAEAAWIHAAEAAQAVVAYKGPKTAEWTQHAAEAWQHAGVAVEDRDGTPAPPEASRCRLPRYVDGLFHRLATASTQDINDGIEALCAATDSFWGGISLDWDDHQDRKDHLLLSDAAVRDLAIAAAHHHDAAFTLMYLLHGQALKPAPIVISVFHDVELTDQDGPLASWLLRDAEQIDPDYARSVLRVAMHDSNMADQEYTVAAAGRLLSQKHYREFLLWYLGVLVHEPLGAFGWASAEKAINELHATGGCPRDLLDPLFEHHLDNKLRAAALAGIVARNDPDVVQVLERVLRDPEGSLVVVGEAVHQVRLHRIPVSSDALSVVLPAYDGVMADEVLMAWLALGRDVPVAKPVLDQWATAPWPPDPESLSLDDPHERYRILAANIVLDLVGKDDGARARILALAPHRWRRYRCAIIEWLEKIDLPRAGELLADVAGVDTFIGANVAPDDVRTAVEQVKLYEDALASMHLSAPVRDRIQRLLDATPRLPPAHEP